MFSSPLLATFTEPYSTLLKSLDAGILDVTLLDPDSEQPPEAANQLVLPVCSLQGHRTGTVILRLDPGADPVACSERVRPALRCLAQTLALIQQRIHREDLRMRRLAMGLDLDLRDDARLDKAVSAVVQRMGVEIGWLAAPRSQLRIAVRGNDHELDAGVRNELGKLRARVAPLTGKVRNPLVINGPAPEGEHSAECRLLLVPLFVGRARHNAWLVLANPLAATPFGGRHMLAAMTLGQALARRLEVDLDRRTGLFNRGGLEAAMPHMKCEHASLVLLDIDRLESVNQLHGMAAGDAAIMSLAQLLQAPLLPGNARVARTMGDQFAILLPGMNAAEAAAFARRVQGAAAAIQPGLPDDPSPMTLSAGVVGIDDVRKPFDRFAIDAGTALELAKDRGRSRIEVFSSGSLTFIRRNDEVLAAADLREALRAGRLQLFAQPIRLMANPLAAPGFELLVRMRDVTGELIGPGEFISAAQRFQLLPDLDQYVAETALDMLSPHRGLLARKSCSFSINISGQSLASHAFVDHFMQMLRASRIPGNLITVEVTEQAALTHLDRAAASMQGLRELGCGIAIDDFGTGANSLAYLRSLPVTRIKIDGSFVRDLLTNPLSEAGVKGIVQLAREYRLDTVAEYVESQPVAQRLQALGVLRGQGYFFGKPEPLEQVLETILDEEDATPGASFARD